MKTELVLFIHLLATVAKCLGPGGGPRVVVAENLLLKHQMLILSRSRQHAPNFFVGDRFPLNFCPRDALIGFPVTGFQLEIAQPTIRLTFRTPLPN